MATKLYFHSSTATYAPTAGEKSTALPDGTANNLSTHESRYMNTTIGTTVTSVVQASLAQTARQSGLMARFSSDRLATQTIGAQTWTLFVGTLEGDPKADTYAAASIYVWRPSNNSVVGYIYDNVAQIGSEFTNNSVSTEAINISGSSVSATTGDILVCEFWYTSAQSKATSYNLTLDYDGNSETVGTNASSASYLLSTDTLSFYAAPSNVQYFILD